MGILYIPREKDVVGIRTPLVHKGRYPHLLRFFLYLHKPFLILSEDIAFRYTPLKTKYGKGYGSPYGERYLVSEVLNL